MQDVSLGVLIWMAGTMCLAIVARKKQIIGSNASTFWLFIMGWVVFPVAGLTVFGSGMAEIGRKEALGRPLSFKQMIGEREIPRDSVAIYCVEASFSYAPIYEYEILTDVGIIDINSPAVERGLGTLLVAEVPEGLGDHECAVVTDSKEVRIVSILEFYKHFWPPTRDRFYPKKEDEK